jgi:uncharacterized OB-fold protein
MNNKPKKRSVKSLMALLGADPNEAAPQSLEEARFMHEMEGHTVEREERSRCPSTGKVSFPSEGQAKQAARSRLNKGSNTSKLRVYRCPDCASFHLSSSFHK